MGFELSGSEGNWSLGYEKASFFDAKDSHPYNVNHMSLILQFCLKEMVSQSFGLGSGLYSTWKTGNFKGFFLH